MPEAVIPALPADVAQPTGFLHTLLTMSLTAVAVLRPLYAEDGKTIRDFAWAYLNSAGQRMLGQPERPSASLLTLFPTAQADGVFEVCCQAFETNESQRNQTNYQADGLDGYFLLVAQRYEDLLVVNFTDTNEQPRSAAEGALRESQAREQAARAEAERQRGELERVFEQAPLAIAVYRGPAYTIELANATVARLWGRTRAQLLGKGLFEALPEVAGMGYEELLDGVMATGVPYVAHAMEAQHERNGQLETVYWDFVYVPLSEADGRISGAMVVATEATAQVLARQQLQQLNEELELRVTARSAEARAAQYEAEQQREQLRVQQGLLSQILGQVPAGVATLSGPQHRYSFFNEPYQSIAAGRAALGLTVSEVFPELVEQGIIQLLDQVYHTGQPFLGTDIALMLHDPTTGQAEPRYVDFTYQPLLDGQQRPQGILIFVLDVTEKMRARKQAETLQAAMIGVLQRQGQERENVYQLFEQAPAAICLLREPDHRIDYHNPAYQALFPGKGLRGHTLAELQTDNPALVTLLDGIYRGEPTQFQPEVLVRVPQPDGQPPRLCYFDFTYQAYREQDKIAGVSIFGFDVTERRLAREQVQNLNHELATINAQLTATNAEVQQSNARLRRTNTDLDTFVYAASHDLKAPIANIEGLLEALREYLPTDAQEPMVPRLVGMMEGAITRFQQTVAHLTDVSHLQDEGASPSEAIDLALVLENVRLDLLPLLESTQAELVLDLAECPPVLFSTKSLRSVLFNLLSNAVKYRAPDRRPQVQVRTECTATHLVLAVQDNGLGLDATQQTQLFTMFRRLHTHIEGSGVGLYLIKRTLENAGGTIAVRSQPGVGSTFTVTIPRA